MLVSTPPAVGSEKVYYKNINLGMEHPLSSVILMKILESSPSRYDRGIRLLTLGKLDAAYDRLVAPIQPGMQVLDIGCGTGALSLRAASRGALVTGMDINPAMLEIAGQRAADAGLDEQITLVEMGVAEFDREPAEHFDAVMSGLCFSELSQDELRYTLEQVQRILKPGGWILVVDEIRPPDLFPRLFHAILRLPLAAVTWLLTQTTTQAVQDLPDRLTAVGLAVDSVAYTNFHSLISLIAHKPEREKPE
jgi:ubiquinone/menaquinone biosynthesis C-methylase UbiE